MAQKKTIILLHGLRGDHYGLSQIAENLEERGYNVHNLDLPGYGENKALDDQSLDGYADWLKQYITQQKLTKPVVIGHSMGSIISSHFAKKYPELSSRKIVLVSPIFRTSKKQKFSKLNYFCSTAFLHLLVPPLRLAFLRAKAFSWVVSHMLTVDKSLQKEIDRQHFDHCGNFHSAKKIMNDIKISMCAQTALDLDKDIAICMGVGDKMTPIKVARERAQEYGILFKEVPGAGHLINYERPDIVADFIADFIS